MVLNALDRLVTAARTAADERTHSRAHGRCPGLPSHVPERLVPAEQARVGLGREESCSMSKCLSQGMASIRALGSCSLAIRSLDPGFPRESGVLTSGTEPDGSDVQRSPNLHPPPTQASSLTPSCPGLKTPIVVEQPAVSQWHRRASWKSPASCNNHRFCVLHDHYARATNSTSEQGT